MNISIVRNLDKSNWETVTFGDVVREVKEVSRNLNADGIEHVVGLEHLSSSDIHIRAWGNVSDGKTFTKKFSKGQVLFGRRRAYQKKAALADFNGICSGDIIVMEAIEDKLDPRLLPFLVHSAGFYNLAISTSAGSLSPRTKFRNLADYEFRMPSLEIQKKLAELFWTVDGVEERLIETIGCLQKTLESTFYSGFQVKNIKQSSLEDIAEISPRAPKETADLRGDVDFIPMDSVGEDGELSLGLKKDFQNNKAALTLFQSGDILFAKITPCMENGKGAMVTNLERKFGLGSTEFHVLRPREEMDRFYIFYLTKMPFFRKTAERYMTGSAGQKRVPASFLKDFKIRLPDIAERESLGYVCHQLWIEKKKYENFLNSTHELKQSIINSVF